MQVFAHPCAERVRPSQTCSPSTSLCTALMRPPARINKTGLCGDNQFLQQHCSAHGVCAASMFDHARPRQIAVPPIPADDRALPVTRYLAWVVFLSLVAVAFQIGHEPTLHSLGSGAGLRPSPPFGHGIPRRPRLHNCPKGSLLSKWSTRLATFNGRCGADIIEYVHKLVLTCRSSPAIIRTYYEVLVLVVVVLLLLVYAAASSATEQFSAAALLTLVTLLLLILLTMLPDQALWAGGLLPLDRITLGQLSTPGYLPGPRPMPKRILRALRCGSRRMRKQIQSLEVPRRSPEGSFSSASDDLYHNFWHTVHLWTANSIDLKKCIWHYAQLCFCAIEVRRTLFGLSPKRAVNLALSISTHAHRGFVNKQRNSCLRPGAVGILSPTISGLLVNSLRTVSAICERRAIWGSTPGRQGPLKWTFNFSFLHVTIDQTKPNQAQTKRKQDKPSANQA